MRQRRNRRVKKTAESDLLRGFCLSFFLLFFFGFSFGFQEEYESIDSSVCVGCHEKSINDTNISDDLSHSIHVGFACLDCHTDKGTLPHKISDFRAGLDECFVCHEDIAQQYKVHGRANLADDEDLPVCTACHGYHDILSSTDSQSRTNPLNLPGTCGACHKDLALITQHQISTSHPVDIYSSSVHGQSVLGGMEAAASCNDCHSSSGTAHEIYSSENPNSSINYFNIPLTCGQCHEPEMRDYWKGIHGQLVKRGDATSPVCTSCHGDHGIISPTDPRSPVSRARLAESTCTLCHESITLTEKYGISTGRRPTFIDNYHGLKTKAGDLFVANCASCHGVHMILPSSDPDSMINPARLQQTCGECHPGISAAMAAVPIHGLGPSAVENKTAGFIKNIYILAIFVIIGLMAIHWLIDLFKQIRKVMKRPQVRRMTTGEVLQHWLLLSSFIVLVITGFAQRFGDAWFSRLLFGFEHGFKIRGIIHRSAAVVLIASTIWHTFHLMTQRGRGFLIDMLPNFLDFKQFFQRVFYNLGLSKKEPQFKRFSYVEKAEYWALVWGNAVMILTGFILWFDGFFARLFSVGVHDVARVIHFYEAILASLAILIWHLYSTVFNPAVYPMNPSWLTGKMPREMFVHEHPLAEIEDAKD